MSRWWLPAAVLITVGVPWALARLIVRGAIADDRLHDVSEED